MPAFPYGFDAAGRTAEASDGDHLRDMIELVLFTTPGERPFRPTFGSGLLGLVFGSNGDALAAAAQLSVQSALQQWLGDRIVVEDVAVESVDARVVVTVRFVDRRDNERRTHTFERSVP